MKLKKLLKDLPVDEVVGSKDLDISGIYNHSGTVAPKGLFIARRGARFDGNEYIFDAILSGAVAVVTDIKNPFLQQVTQIVTKDIQELENQLVRRFYGDVTKDFSLIGITGTNGKTTTGHILYHLLGVDTTGFIGTLGCQFQEERYPCNTTTPDYLTLHKRLCQMQSEKCTACALEVSSHAIHQNRIKGVSFDYGIFTNLTPEHLDYHNTTEEYARVKRSFFNQVTQCTALNIEDSWAPYMRVAMQSDVLTYGLTMGDFHTDNIRTSLRGTRFTLCYPGGELEVESPLLGEINIYNLLASLCILYAKGIDIKELLPRIRELPSVPGRLQPIRHPKGCQIFVDYAHTEDALYRTLQLLSKLCDGRIITIFGCGGERDQKKRPKMARVAESFSDAVIVTHDNPRREDPMVIIEEICAGFLQNHYAVIEDRKEAIRYAIEEAGPKDLILIAGKGHESEQIFENQSFILNDAEVATSICTSTV